MEGTTTFYIMYSTPNDIGGGYAITNPDLPRGTLSETGLSLVSGDYAGYPIIKAVYNSSYTAPTFLSSSRINSYISAKAVTGYSASIVAPSEYDYYTRVNYNNETVYVYVITIRYTPNSDAHRSYYKVQYNTAAPSGKGYTLNTSVTLANNTTVTNSSGSTYDFYASNPSNNDHVAAVINWKNVDKVISPTTVNGYLTKVIAGGGSGTQADPYIITINYFQQWEKDGLLYSTFHVESTSHQYALPAGQVAVSLYRGEDVILPGGTIGQVEQDATNGWTIETITDIIAYEGGVNGNEEQLTTTTGETTTDASDDDGDVAGTTATYKCLGQLAKDIPCTEYVDENGQTRTSLTFSSDYFYERTHQVAVSKLVNVTIPSTVVGPDGNPYNVTAIQKFGFNYAATDQNNLTYCPMGDDNNSIQIADNINDHRNDYLQTVEFATPCQVTSIGDYAFMSCRELENFTVPYTVSYLGTGTFECSQNLEWVEFQEGPDGTSNVKVIRDWTFWYCTGLQRVWLADGLERIEGQASGSSFQYLPALREITLPNTLEYIGPHFLCSATGIQEVTIPASVTYIDGALFHGCESLRDVWMMGDAAYLQGIDGTSRTFDFNETLCGDHVHDMTLHVPSTYLTHYTSETASDGGFNTWNELDENNAENIANNYRNKIVPVEGQEREFKALRWQSVVFPKRVPNENRTENPTGQKVYPEVVFGSAHSSDEQWDDGLIVAEMTQAVRDEDNISLYHLTFTEVAKVNGRYELDVDKPYMIRPAKAATFEMYSDADEHGVENFMVAMTDDHTLSVEANDGAVIQMKGWYIQHKLSLYDFIFKDETTRYTFRKNTVDGGAYAGPCRCWWTIKTDGIRSTTSEAMGVVRAKDILDRIGGVNADEQGSEIRFVVDGIYDMNGRRIPLKQEELPAGMFIINGKKVLVK